MLTIYQKAKESIDREIAIYLNLLEATENFNKLSPASLSSKENVILFGAGLGLAPEQSIKSDASYLISEFDRKSALNFDVEAAICTGVYTSIRSYSYDLFDHAKDITNNFTTFTSDNFINSPALLPIYQNVLGLSKSQLKKRVGTASDTHISKPAAEKLANLMLEHCNKIDVNKENTLLRLEITLEGIVRDLVGRVVFEEIVSHALRNEGVLHLREDEYPNLSGVIYDFRADFVIPNHKQPLAFIEVRKSSSRHASLYAKDKMFSAINWKGNHNNLIGIIVTEGDWTQATLKTMSSVFDYVIPLNKANKLAKMLKRLQDGDKSLQKWLIEFKIKNSPNFANHEI